MSTKAFFICHKTLKLLYLLYSFQDVEKQGIIYFHCQDKAMFQKRE